MRIRPSLQFSLRGLLVLTTIACLALGRWVETARNQRDAVDAVLQAGGRVTYNNLPERGKSDHQTEFYVNRKDQHDSSIDYWYVPTNIEVSYGKDADEILSHLKGVPTVRLLGLVDCHVTDKLMQYILNDWGTPRVLFLSYTDITDDQLKKIATIEELTHLNLLGTSITDEGLCHLSQLKRLRYLTLVGTQVTDAGLVHLRGLAELRQLGVSYTRVTKNGRRALQAALPRCNIIQ